MSYDQINLHILLSIRFRYQFIDNIKWRIICITHAHTHTRTHVVLPRSITCLILLFNLGSRFDPDFWVKSQIFSIFLQYKYLNNKSTKWNCVALHLGKFGFNSKFYIWFFQGKFSLIHWTHCSPHSCSTTDMGGPW